MIDYAPARRQVNAKGSKAAPKTYVCWQGICAFSGALFLRLTALFSDLCRGVFGQALCSRLGAPPGGGVPLSRRNSRERAVLLKQ